MERHQLKHLLPILVIAAILISGCASSSSYVRDSATKKIYDEPIDSIFPLAAEALKNMNLRVKSINKEQGFIKAQSGPMRGSVSTLSSGHRYLSPLGMHRVHDEITVSIKPVHDTKSIIHVNVAVQGDLVDYGRGGRTINTFFAEMDRVVHHTQVQREVLLNE